MTKSFIRPGIIWSFFFVIMLIYEKSIANTILTDCILEIAKIQYAYSLHYHIISVKNEKRVWRLGKQNVNTILWRLKHNNHNKILALLSEFSLVKRLDFCPHSAIMMNFSPLSTGVISEETWWQVKTIHTQQ